MTVGILKEIKTEENRVCITPAGVEVMKAKGHSVLVEKDARNDSGFDDAMYLSSRGQGVWSGTNCYRQPAFTQLGRNA